MKKFNYFVGIFAVTLLLGAGCAKETPSEQVEVAANDSGEYAIAPSEQAEAEKELQEKMKGAPVKDSQMVELKSKIVQGVDFQISGDLKDVSGGSSTGVAMTAFKYGNYMMHAKFKDLPPLEDGYFYEGWVVRKKPFNFISTGEIVDVRGELVNTYMSEDNWMDHDFYVLTLEPDDGDPAPAAHILEGVMTPIKR